MESAIEEVLLLLKVDAYFDQHLQPEEHPTTTTAAAAASCFVA